MPPLDFDSVKNKQIPERVVYSRPSFLWKYVKTIEFTNDLTITDLEAGVSYSIYCYARSLNRLPSITYRRLDFTLKSSIKRAPENSDFYSSNRSG